MEEDETLSASGSRPDGAVEQGRVGPYKLLSKLGEGGMGEVWLAEQESPRRPVALKVIKRGMDTRQVIARFETERQALAVMDHPNIARVIDAGETERGRPYFVMEYVKGEPITSYCDRNLLTTRERLELFIRVCEGVQHAHQKAVIHRDLKPSNILVTVQGDEPVPKIIDFGVAKAISQRLTERTLFTELGQMIGTPEYMSPEQAEMSGVDIDTRTDVYSLGVLLYELLTGVLPFDPKELRAGGLAEIQRRIREEEPAKPSTRISDLGDTSTELARRRRIDASTLVKRLRGDLDWITVRALEKDRTRRYASPLGIAADVGRYLRHEPVLASPPSRWYRAIKFTRRHRVGVGLAALVAALLIAFGSAMAIQSARVARERDRAELEAARALALNRFMEETVLSPDPEGVLGREVTVAEALASARDRIDELSGDRPEIRASLQAAIGRAFLELGRYEEAEPLVLAALETRRRLLGPSHADTAESELRLGELHLKRGDNPSAEKLYRQALATRRARLDPDDLDIAEALDLLAEVLIVSGRYDEAGPLLQEALAISAAQDPEGAGVASAKNKLGIVAWNREEYEAAEAHYRDALAIERRVFSEDHAMVAGTLNNLGVLLYSTDDLEQAEGIFRELVEVQRRAYGESHEEVATAVGNLAAVVEERGDLDEAEELFRRALEIDRQQLGDAHPNVAIDLANLGELLVDRGRAREACPILQDAHRVLVGALEPGHWRIALAQHAHGDCLATLGRYAEAERELLESVRSFEESSGPDSQRTRDARRSLVDLYEAWGRPEKASDLRALLAESGGPDLGARP